MKYSIVIPTYNGEKRILTTLSSLKEQTYSNIEIIVINDGSIDNTESVILKFKKDNPKLDIKYQRIENSGPSKARNVGISLASGDYICFLDSDDTYDKDLFLELDKMISKDVDIVYFGYNEYDEDGNLIFKFEDSFKYFFDLSGVEMAKKKYLKETWINNCNVIYKLDLIKKNSISYPEGIYLGEDANFIYKCLFNAKVVKCLPKEYFYNYINKKSLFNSSFSIKNVTEFKAIENTLDYIVKNNIPEVYDYIYSLYYHTRVTVAKKMVLSLKWYQCCKFKKLVKRYISKIKKPKVLYFNKKQRFETRLFSFSKTLFLWFTRFYYKTHKK